MNSRELKKKFEDKYKNFHNLNDLIISLPYTMSFLGSYPSLKESINARQKIPLRVYIGIKKTKELRLKLGEIEYYDFSEDDFLSERKSKYHGLFAGFEEYLEKEYKERIKELSLGIEISIFSEIPDSAGLGLLTLSSILFILGIEMLLGSDPIKEKTGDMNYLFRNPTTINDILKKFQKLEKSLGLSLCSATAIAAFFDSASPIVAYNEEEKNETLWGDTGINSFRLENLFPASSKSVMHLDYGLAYCGRPAFNDLPENISISRDYQLNRLENGFKDMLKKSNNDSGIGESMLKDILKNKDTFDSSYFDNLFNNINIQAFYSLLKLFSTRFDDTSFREFIDSMDKVRWSKYMLHDRSSTFKDYIANLIINFPSPKREIALIPNDAFLNGGTASFVILPEAYRKGFQNTFEAVREKFPNSKIIFSSWQYGVENTGFSIEKDSSKGIYSEFMKDDTFTLTNPTDGTVISGEYEELLNKRKKGIVFDTLSKKILIDGEKVGSSRIPSQQTAISLLEILFHNPKSEISNKELPKSSYSKNRNDMVGKIILPLNKLFKETHTKLSMSCRGTLDEYYIRLENNEKSDSVYLLKKI